MIRNSVGYLGKIAAVVEKAKEARLKTEIHEFQYGDDVTLNHYILFPAGKVKRKINLSMGERINSLLSIELDRISFLGDYDAIADLENGEIEAAITTRDPYGMATLERRLGFTPSFMSNEGDDRDEDEFTLRAERLDGTSVEISKCTEELAALSSRPHGIAHHLV